VHFTTKLVRVSAQEATETRFKFSCKVAEPNKNLDVLPTYEITGSGSQVSKVVLTHRRTEGRTEEQKDFNKYFAV
jgi:hypothetical protein